MTDIMRLVMWFIVGNVLGVLVGAAIQARRMGITYRDALQMIIEWYLGGRW